MDNNKNNDGVAIPSLLGVSCRKCTYFRRETESWEMPDIWWYACKLRPSMANIKSFPFENTKCKWFAAANLP